MRHLVKGRKLGRTASHRGATMRALSVALIKEHRITTTVPKAKELRTFVEPLITRAKEDTSHNRRKVFSKLNDKAAVSQLFDEVAPKAKDRPGGYTRVIKAGFRSGDGAELAVIELVDYNDIKPEKSSKRKRTRRAGKDKKTPTATPEKQGKSGGETEAAESEAKKTKTGKKRKAGSKKSAEKKDKKDIKSEKSDSGQKPEKE